MPSAGIETCVPSRPKRLSRSILLRIGRWLEVTHPRMTLPEHWNRRLAAEAVAAIDRMSVGDLPWRTNLSMDQMRGKPLSPRAKAQWIQALRVFFQDAQEWEWIPRRFNPVRAFAIPRSIRALIGPDPRTIPNEPNCCGPAPISVAMTCLASGVKVGPPRDPGDVLPGTDAPRAGSSLALCRSTE